MRLSAPNLMANNYNDYNFIGSEIDCDETAKLFKKIKDKGNIRTTLKVKLYDEPSKNLLETNFFIDKVEYYRRLKRISKRQLSQEVGIDDQTYIDYERKLNQLSNPYLAEKFIKVLGVEDELELPDYYEFMKKYPHKKIVQYIKENFSGPTEFSRKSKINLGTIRSWVHAKKDMNITLECYKQLYDFFKKQDKEF